MTLICTAVGSTFSLRSPYLSHYIQPRYNYDVAIPSFPKQTETFCLAVSSYRGDFCQIQ